MYEIKLFTTNFQAAPVPPRAEDLPNVNAAQVFEDERLIIKASRVNSVWFWTREDGVGGSRIVDEDTRLSANLDGLAPNRALDALIASLSNEVGVAL